MRPYRALGALLLALGALAAWSAQSLEVAFAADPLGPRGFPTVVAGLLAACGALLVLRPAADGFAWPERPAAPPLLVVAMAAYALLLEPAGFLLATAALGAAVAFLFGARPLAAALVGAATAVALWLLFDGLLDLPLPKGFLF